MATRTARRLAISLLSVILIASTPGLAQQELAPVTSAATAILKQMTLAAGVIFAGEVISVTRPAGFAGSAQEAATGTVLVQFRVDQAVRGCSSGSVFTLREWAGLWTGNERYRVGQRLLMFLHAPNGNGLTSPVHGTTGAVPLRGAATAPGPYDASAVAGSWVVDLRWLQAQAAREAIWIEQPPSTHSRHPEPMPEPMPKPMPEPKFPARDSPTAEFVPTRVVYQHWRALPATREHSTQPLAQLLGLCREWVRSSDGTP